MPPRVYRDDSGITLTMVFLKEEPGVPNKALVRFTGTQHPTAGKVMLAENTGSFQHQSWRIRYDGQDKVLVSQEFTGRDNDAKLRVMLHMPKARESVRMQFHEEETRTLNVNEFIAIHERHVADGSLASFAELDIALHKKKYVESLNYENKRMVEECKGAIPYELDWDTISAEQMKYDSVCEVMLEAIADGCRRDGHSRSTIRKSIKKLRCSHSEENALDLQEDINYSDQMNFTVAKAKLAEALAFGDAVVADDKGRILVFDPTSQDSKSAILLGDEKNLYSLHASVYGKGAWDPYAKGESARISRREDDWEVQCSKKAILFHTVPAELRKKVLANAKRHPIRWKRRSFALARDNRGTYYYVDRFHPRYGGKNYRVFKGQRGQLEETTLVDIVDDSDGKIFATKRGQLRLVLGKNQNEEALWIEGKTRHKLVVLPLFENQDLIYAGLGVYDTDTMGTICE